MKKNKKGFTLVEILVVILVLAILFGVLISRMDFAGDAAKEDVLSADMIVFENAIVATAYQAWGFTDSQTALITSLNNNIDPSYAFVDAGSYFTSAKSDPWGNAYRFVFTPSSQTLTVYYHNDHTETEQTREYKFDINGITGQLLRDGITLGAPDYLVSNPVVLPALGATLEDCTWEQIDAIIDQGKGDEYFDIGDTKKLDLGADVDGDGTNDSFTFRIVGFNHDEAEDGSVAGVTFLCSSSTIVKRMDPASTSTYDYGSRWDQVELRTWLNGTVFEALPSILKDNIVAVKKLSDGGCYNQSLITTTDKLWVPSMEEVGINMASVALDGNTYYDSVAGQGTEYKYFANGGSLVINGDSTAEWWSRSTPSYDTDKYFWTVVNGGRGLKTQQTECTVAFGFCMGREQNDPWTEIEATLPEKGTALEDFTWEQIITISEAGKAAEYFEVGDVKALIPAENLGDPVVLVEIAGFNHDDLADGSGKAGITFITYTTVGTIQMNSSQRNTGGWSQCDARTTIASYINSNQFPDELKTAIKAVTKISDVGYSTYALDSGVSDKLWIPSITEMGLESSVSSCTKGQGSAYELYTSSSGRIAKVNMDDYSAASYVLRSSLTSNSSYFLVVSTLGTCTGGTAAQYSAGLVFGFCI